MTVAFADLPGILEEWRCALFPLHLLDLGGRNPDPAGLRRAAWSKARQAGARFEAWWIQCRPAAMPDSVRVALEPLLKMAAGNYPPGWGLERIQAARAMIRDLPPAPVAPTLAPAPDGPVGPRGWRHLGREFHDLDGGEAIEVMILMADKPDGFWLEVRAGSPKKLAQRVRKNCRIIGLPWTVSLYGGNLMRTKQEPKKVPGLGPTNDD